MSEYVVLCLAAFAAGAVNAVAGGGTLLTFPVLFAELGSSGAAAVMANATSTVALVPASLTAFAGYWTEIKQERRWAQLLFWPSLLGGLAGSLLLVWLSGDIFKSAVPWLILTAALLFALQPSIARLTGVDKAAAHPHQSQGFPHSRWTLFAVIVFQFLVSVYGGYFGAGIGILMLSALAMMGLDDIHRMNAVKTLLAAVINGASVAVFVTQGIVHWPYAIAMAISSSIGGYAAARIARKLNKSLVRAGVVAIGFGLAGYYFYRQFG